jgi:hypothetical protein
MSLYAGFVGPPPLGHKRTSMNTKKMAIMAMSFIIVTPNIKDAPRLAANPKGSSLKSRSEEERK